MKRSSIVQLALAFVVMVGVYAFAQEEGEGMHRHQPPNVDEQVRHLTRALNLNPDQQAQVRTISQEHHDQVAKLMQDSSMTREERGPKMKEAQETADGKIRDLLNDVQKKKFDALRAHQREKWQERHNHPGGSEPAPPPPQ